MLRLLNTDAQSFSQIVKNKRVYGFGVSRTLQLHRVFWNLEDMIYKFVDNDSNKWQTDYQYERLIPIISPMAMYREITKEDIILIISVHYQEVVKQLDQIPALDGITCYILSFLGDYFDSSVDKKLFERTKAAKYCIPPIIHFCWFGGKEIPDNYKRYMETWQEFCPNYEIKRWDEGNYDVLKHPYMKSAYELKKWEYVSDYARLDVLYQYGGIYLDTDVELIKSLDELRYFQAFAGFESEQTVDSGMGIGATPYNDVIKKFRDAYDHYEEVKTGYTIPCPVHQTKILNDMGLKGNNSFQVLDNGNIVILPTEYLCGMRLHTHLRQFTENTIGVHHFEDDDYGLDDNRENWDSVMKRVDFGM